MYLLVIAVSAAVMAYTVNQILVRFSKKLGALSEGNKKGELRWASHSKPLVGGIVFFLVFLVTALLLYVLEEYLVTGPDAGFLALLLASTIAFVVGLSDDAYNTTPGLKFIGQLSCSLLLIAFGQHIEFSGVLAIDYALTILWVVGLMNSFNMLDNMDGVSGTFSLSVMTIIGGALWLTGYAGSFYFYLIIAMAGSHLGFLALNWKPSKLYMGDTGSQFLGLLLAFIGIELVWNMPANGVQSLHRQFLVPQLVFLVTIMDTTFVTIARLSRRQSPFVGGKDHITHHLVYLGVPESLVPLVLGITSLVSGLLALVVLVALPNWSWIYGLLIWGYIALVFVVFGAMYILGLRKHQEATRQPTVVSSATNRHSPLLSRSKVLSRSSS